MSIQQAEAPRTRDDYAALEAKGRVFCVENVRTGERSPGKQSYSEACSHAGAMRRNWGYKKTFVVVQGWERK